jgi:hypothetical protein
VHAIHCGGIPQTQELTTVPLAPPSLVANDCATTLIQYYYDNKSHRQTQGNDDNKHRRNSNVDNKVFEPLLGLINSFILMVLTSINNRKEEKKEKR